MRRILFRADSSSTIGTGHIMRDLVLAKREFSEGHVAFAVRDLPDNINHRIEEAGYDLILLEGDDIEELAEKTKEFGADTIVIDHYGIGYEEEKRLKERTGASLFVLDDTYERHHCDILLNHNVYADPDRYRGRVPDGCELRCGAAYTLIRREFVEAKASRHRHPSASRVLVAMGGADTAGLNLPVVEVLSRWPGVGIDIVTTRANRRLAELERAVAPLAHVTLHLETPHMARLMARARLAVVTPSVTLNEVIYMGLPFVAIQTADNQREMADYLQRKGAPLLRSWDPEALHKALTPFLEGAACASPF
ncbi:UDP-2,4-diacetamido-2,4,6-trideoxy-beta-L-altropyranose hydrolase [Hydrogenimonas sp.]